MKKTWIHIAIIMLLVFSCVFACCNPKENFEEYSPNKQPSGNQFDFPGNYAAPELVIDGNANDTQWGLAKTIATFGKNGSATILAYRGEKALFFFVVVDDTILLTEGESNDDTVTRSDSIEIYIDSKADGGSKPQSDDYQINLGIHGKTRIMQGSGREWGNWNGLIDYEVNLLGTLNDGIEATDNGYTVEIMIPYAQIGIESDDTIGVSFAQVDKVGLGASGGSDWDWFGWNFNGILVEPQTPNNYVLLDKNNNLTARGQEAKPNADMVGYVMDHATNQPVEDVTVTIVGESAIAPVTTDAQGYFEFVQVSPEQNYTLSFEKEGYLTTTEVYTRAELRESNGGRVLKNITIRDENSIAKTTIQGTVKNVVNGIVAGATVSVVGNSELTATTGADGTFSIANVPAEIDLTLSVSGEGYGTSTTDIKASSLVENDVSALGDISINLPYAQSGKFGGKSNAFADSSLQLSRTLTGVEFILSGTRQLNGNVEIYLDVKDCASHRDQDATMWRFDLRGDGTVGVDNYAQPGEGSAGGLVYTLYQNDATGYSAKFFVPYSYLGISPLEVFGISLGQWSNSAGDWDGWERADLPGANGEPFVKPETPADYIRVGATNELYNMADNNTYVAISGNAGMEGVTVQVGDRSTTTATDGSWMLKVPASADAMSIVYTRQGYVSVTTTIPADYFATHVTFTDTVELQLQKVTISGTVSDSITNAGVGGVTVTIVGTELTATTDDQGNYSFANVGTIADIKVRFEKDGYATQEKNLSVLELSSQNAHTVDVTFVPNSQVKYLPLTGTITNVNGPVEGATVSVVGNSELTAITGADGKFTIESFAGVDCAILVEKAGYISKEIDFKAESIGADEEAHDIGSHDFLLDYAKFHGLIADKDDSFAYFQGYVTRSATGFEFKFVGSKAFTGKIELFVDTKTSTANNARDTSDYLFNLNADGTIQIVNWGTGTKNESVPTSMKLTVTGADTTNPVVTFTLPYAFFGQVDATKALTATEVIGVSAGQHNGSAWDGWDNQALWGVNNSAFVAPEWTQDYIRVGAHNEIYNHTSNDTLNLDEYQINFGTGYSAETVAGAKVQSLADNFYAKVVSRDQTGVTFEFITTGDFGKEGDQNEMVLIYFDLGETVAGANWTGIDYMIKIASDGNVYGRASSAWWSATEADKLGTVTITRENGVTTFSLKVDYTTLGIQASDVFGIAMREASHNATDHHLYDMWYDCYFEKGSNIGIPAAGIDAAQIPGYIRVTADGTLYLASSNDAQ